jgi:hypothetical protein
MFAKLPNMKTSIPLVLVTFALVCFALVQNVQAIVPAPDGGYSGDNTGEGQNALLSLTTGKANTAIGAQTLYMDVDGSYNTAGGHRALHDTIDVANTATGTAALSNNTTGGLNTANGYRALYSNTTGRNNVALGQSAGASATTGSGNVYIGAGMQDVAGESDACYIKSIFGQTSATGIPVLINSSNKLGTTTSSQRFKEDIKPMDKASEELLALRPVTFHYKKEIDPAGISQFGLVAEEVEKVNPDPVVRDTEGKPYSVRYDQVNAMLLNEFLKEHCKVEQLEKQVETLTAGLQKVSAQLAAASLSGSGLEMNKFAMNPPWWTRTANGAEQSVK